MCWGFPLFIEVSVSSEEAVYVCWGFPLFIEVSVSSEETVYVCWGFPIGFCNYSGRFGIFVLLLILFML